MNCCSLFEKEHRLFVHLILTYSKKWIQLSESCCPEIMITNHILEQQLCRFFCEMASRSESSYKTGFHSSIARCSLPPWQKFVRKKVVVIPTERMLVSISQHTQVHGWKCISLLPLMGGGISRSPLSVVMTSMNKLLEWPFQLGHLLVGA